MHPKRSYIIVQTVGKLFALSLSSTALSNCSIVNNVWPDQISMPLVSNEDWATSIFIPTAKLEKGEFRNSWWMWLLAMNSDEKSSETQIWFHWLPILIRKEKQIPVIPLWKRVQTTGSLSENNVPFRLIKTMVIHTHLRLCPEIWATMCPIWNSIEFKTGLVFTSIRFIDAV